MKKNKLLLIVLLLIFIVLVVALVIVFRPKTTSNTNIDSIDMSTLNEKIITQGNFNATNMQDIDISTCGTIFNIDASIINNVIGKMPLVNVTSSMYVVIEVKEKINIFDIKQKLEEYAQSYEKQWNKYLQDQYEIVKLRKIGSKGNYVYMFISDNPKELEDLL